MKLELLTGTQIDPLLSSHFGCHIEPNGNRQNGKPGWHGTLP